MKEPKKFIGWTGNQKGQATFEYIVILSVILIASLALVQGINTALDESLLRFGGKLEQNLKTGRSPAGVWRN